MADELPIPVEIPWQLASTTQPLVPGQPADTSISLFTFVPDAEATEKDFPDQRVIFLKVAATLSPAAFPPGTAPIVASMLGEGVPCYHAQLDMIVRRKDGSLGTIRPYFHAAAPLRREMLKTGVVGGESFEGTSDHQAVGRSSSQLYETSQSHAATASISAGGSFLGFGASASFTTTDVSGRRSVDQVSDTTTRDASQERRELVSHMTRVENVLTLLNAKYLGTPYVRFSLSPRPLEQLAIDPSDPSLWFGQLLQRRSSGIEGVQEFTVVLLVPKGEDFCVETRLKRVCVLDDPPVEPDFSEQFNFSAPFLVRVLQYIYRTYPIGTPVDDLDVVIRHGTGALGPDKRPVVESWVIGADGRLIADVVATNGNPVKFPGVVRDSANYKTYVELWLETLRDEYEHDLSLSPLEVGSLLGETRTLDTCFTFNALGGLGVLNSQTSVLSLRPVRLDPRELGFTGPPATPAALARSTKARALETVVRWNTLSARLGKLLDNPPEAPTKSSGRFNNERFVNLLVSRWAKLRPGDPRNLPLTEMGKALGFDRKLLKALKSAGISNLGELGQALKAVPTIENYNAGLAPRRAARKGERPAQGLAAAPIEPPIDRTLATEIARNIGKVLLAPIDDDKER